MTYIIRCRVSGGVTGTRESVLKRNGVVVHFDDQHEAQREADRLVREMNHSYSVARFDYWVDVDCIHEWVEQPGELPFDVCVRCGAVRE